MASAFVHMRSAGPPTTTPTFIRFQFDVAFFGTDVEEGREWDAFDLELAGDASVTQIRNAITAAVQERASAAGFSVAKSSITMPAFSKG